MIDEKDNEIEEDESEVLVSVGLKATNYTNIVNRYFTKYYIDEGTEKEQYIFLHTNGIVMCGLGKNHLLCQNGIKIKEIVDLQKVTKISGKRKHGAHILMDNEKILHIVIEEDKEIADNKDHINIDRPKIVDNIFCFIPRVKGKLIEINSILFNNPKIIQESPEKSGFMCFLLLEIDAGQRLRDKLEKNKLENSLNK